MIRLSAAEFADVMTLTDRLVADVKSFDEPPPDTFGLVVEGFGTVGAGLAVFEIAAALNLVVAAVTIAPADAECIEHTVLADGRIELTFRPQDVAGVEIALATDCPHTARELSAALICGGVGLAAGLADGAVLGGDLADMEPTGVA
ncbi:MAG: hypothetical protein ABTQ29_12235 [Siculibacillus sp.]